MTVLREIISRFRLTSKKEDFKAIDDAVAKTKGGLSSLAAAFGITFGIAGGIAIARTGLSAERTTFQLKRLAGTNFGPLREQFREVQKELNGIRSGAANIIRPKQFDQAAAEFTRAFGSGDVQTKTFGKIFSFAAKQAALTGKDVVEVVKDIQQGILGGGFENLQDIPGFDVFKKKMLEFQQDIINPNEPGGRVAIQNRMRAILDVISKATPDQNDALKTIPKTLLTADQAANKLQDTLEHLGDILMKSLVPALEKMVKLLDWALKKFVDIDEQATKAGVNPALYMAGEAWSGAAKGVADTVESPNRLSFRPTQKQAMNNNLSMFQRWDDIYKGNIPRELDDQLSRQPGYADFKRQKQKLSAEAEGMVPGLKADKPVTGLGMGGDVQINNTFHITSTDPMQAAQEAKKQFSDSLRSTRSSMIQTESR